MAYTAHFYVAWVLSHMQAEEQSMCRSSIKCALLHLINSIGTPSFHDLSCAVLPRAKSGRMYCRWVSCLGKAHYCFLED